MYSDFNTVCEYRSQVPGVKGNSVPSNDPSIGHVIQSLENIAKVLESSFGKYRGIDFKFVPSKGASVFPFVPYVAILPPNQSVSKGIYVVICFDKYGKGALVGCAESKTNSQGLRTVKRTAKGKTLRIDVNGPKSNTHYNDVFAQPREFHFPLRSEQELLAHIELSLDRALVELGSLNIDSADISIQEEKQQTSSFDPKNLEDARKKITREIHARQGQAAFREMLLAEYGRCLISGCKVSHAIEAAHIVPYKGEATNSIENGLLLRADIHTLFDLGLISITPYHREIVVSKRLSGTDYELYAGTKLQGLAVSDEALLYHYETTFKI
ncbi:HNH endonuclease [Vibrio gigantis]|uniref:HNH endonuclease n=1 Tax=Vibrio gigantis TaxID=296199 RepID=UPI0035A73B79